MFFKQVKLKIFTFTSQVQKLSSSSKMKLDLNCITVLIQEMEIVWRAGARGGGRLPGKVTNNF